VILVSDFAAFYAEHDRCRELDGPSVNNGPRVIVTCSCGAAFSRLVQVSICRIAQIFSFGVASTTRVIKTMLGPSRRIAGQLCRATPAVAAGPTIICTEATYEKVVDGVLLLVRPVSGRSAHLLGAHNWCGRFVALRALLRSCRRESRDLTSLIASQRYLCQPRLFAWTPRAGSR